MSAQTDRAGPNPVPTCIPLGNNKYLPAMCPEDVTGALQLTLMVSSLRKQDSLHSASSPPSNNVTWGTSSLGEFPLRFLPGAKSEESIHSLGSSYGSHTCSGHLDLLVLSVEHQEMAKDVIQVHEFHSLSLPSFPLLTLLYVSRSLLLRQQYISYFKKSHFCFSIIICLLHSHSFWNLLLISR